MPKPRSVPVAPALVGPLPTTTVWVASVPPFSTFTYAFVVPPGVPKVKPSFACVNTAVCPTPNERNRETRDPAPVTVKVPVEPAPLPMKLLHHAPGEVQAAAFTVASTTAPAETVRDPVPQLPTCRRLTVVPPSSALVPGPLTVTEPLPVPESPMLSASAFSSAPAIAAKLPAAGLPMLTVLPVKSRRGALGLIGNRLTG